MTQAVTHPQTLNPLLGELREHFKQVFSEVVVAKILNVALVLVLAPLSASATLAEQAHFSSPCRHLLLNHFTPLQSSSAPPAFFSSLETNNVLPAAPTAPAEPPSSQGFRYEQDLLGSKPVPIDAYYGVQTVRAQENFPISRTMVHDYPLFIKALALVKQAAADSNLQLGLLPPDIHQAITRASSELSTGRYNNQFAISMFQGGAGTSTNMMVNEIIANIASEQAGREKGTYDLVHPNDHVNMSQSTNDFYPTAIKLALLMMSENLKAELQSLQGAFFDLGQRYLENLKMGRTEFQDAVPMTSGQEFLSFAAALEWEYENIVAAEKALLAINMGGTAIGTQINAPLDFPQVFADNLTRLTGQTFAPAGDLIAGTWSMHSFVVYSSALKSAAVTLTKISRDLMLLSSGPRNGLFEIRLPERQPGSSIMPGKVNPVMPEVLTQVSLRVMANDLAVTLAAENGVLQLNAYEPLVALSLFESLDLLSSILPAFREYCVEGLVVNTEVTRQHISTTAGIVTALVPVIGYKASTKIAAEAYRTGRGVLELIREQGLLSEQQIEELLDPATMTNLNKTKNAGELD